MFVQKQLYMLKYVYTKQCKKNQNKIKAVFDASMKWHLIEAYGRESFTELPYSSGTRVDKEEIISDCFRTYRKIQRGIRKVTFDFKKENKTNLYGRQDFKQKYDTLELAKINFKEII